MEGLRGSCRAGLGDDPFTVVRLELEVRPCGAGLEGVPPGGDVAVAGAAFLLDRGAGSLGRWVLRDGFPAKPGWDTPGAPGAPGVFGTAPESSRRVVRALPGLAPAFGTAGPPGWGAREAPAGAFGVDEDAFPPMVTLVWAEVWLVLFTVLPPAVWLALWVERADWRDAPVPAAPDCAAFGCFGAVAFGTVPAVPGRELPVPAAPGADVLAAPDGGT